nr:MAG TPA: hypothetical protein [Caudoviricetes sp.]
MLAVFLFALKVLSKIKKLQISLSKYLTNVKQHDIL